MIERNALAELAERLDKIVFGLITDGHPCDETIDIRKAQRIVAELAKVKINAIKENPSMIGGAFINLMVEIRAIAEEGAEDGWNHCENALTCYKDAHGEWWCDCYVLGNAQAIGLQCGKGVCELYKAEDETEDQLMRARKAKGAKE